MKTQNKARTSDLSRQRFSIKNGSMTPPETWGAAQVPITGEIRRPETFTEAEWSDRVKHFYRDRQWSRLWGPSPGENGCQVPAHLLSAEAGIGPGARRAGKPQEGGSNHVVGGVKAGLL